MDAISLDAAQAIVKFAESGGLVISVGDLPSLGESEANTPGVRALMAALFGENGKGLPDKSGAFGCDHTAHAFRML